MPDVTNYNAVMGRRRRAWAAEGPMDLALTEGLGGGTVACHGQTRIFDAAHDSAIARWAAAQICSECPIKLQCFESAADCNEVGVWGGLFSSGGDQWVPPRHIKRSDAVRSLLAAIDTLTGEAMLRAADAVIPGVVDFFLLSGNEFRLEGQCIIRPSRQGLLPDGNVGSIRHFVLETMLFVETGIDHGSAHVDCDTLDCVAPWHLNWLRGSRTVSRGIALGLYATQMAGWNVNRAAAISGIRNTDLKSILSMAGALTHLDRLPPPSIPKMREAYESVHGIAPSTSELNCMVRLCAAADELDCDTIRDLIAYGGSEFNEGI